LGVGGSAGLEEASSKDTGEGARERSPKRVGSGMEREVKNRIARIGQRIG